jgi:hypothetical protein
MHILKNVGDLTSLTVSHKLIHFSTGEEIEFDVAGTSAQAEASEMSSLTDFIRHQATD